MNSGELKELLRATTAFSILGERELDQLADLFELIHFALGQDIVRAGDDAEAFFIIYSGRARVIAIDKTGQEVSVGTLTRGDSFGEQGLLTSRQRNYTIRASSDLVALRLAKVDFDDLLGRHVRVREYFDKYISEISIRNFLKLSTAFAPLSPQEIRNLLGSLEVVEYEPDTAIIREGEAGDAFFILRTGGVRVIKESNGGKVLNQLKAGDSFGELALLTGQPRATSIITSEPSSVFRLSKREFDRIIGASPKFKDAIISIASGYSATAIAEHQKTAAPVPATQTPATQVYKPHRQRNYPALLQLSETDCGAACLSMILRFYGKQVSVNKLRDLANVSREGSSLYSIAQAAESLGFESRGLKTSWDRLTKLELPAIAHWQGFHFVVVYEVKGDRVTLADPAIGLRKISREEFERDWTGYLLLLAPTAKIEDVEESQSQSSRFVPLLKPYRRVLVEIFLASLLLQFFGLALPIFTQVIVDNVLVHKNTSMLNMLLVGMLLIGIFQTTTTALRYYLLVQACSISSALSYWLRLCGQASQKSMWSPLQVVP